MAVVCGALVKHQVDFMIVGGFAVNYYGHRRISSISFHKPQLKADFDFWYKPSLLNFQRVLKALEDLDITTTDLNKIVFDPKRTFLKIPNKDYHIDFLPEISGLGAYAESKKNANTIKLGDVHVLIIGYNDLILSKLAINRKIDQEDIKALEKIREKKDSKKPDTEDKEE